MKLNLQVAGEGFDDVRLDRVTRDLLKDIRADVDPAAQLPKAQGEAGAKGDVAMIGQIALALISGGVVTKLVEQLTGYVNRNRKISVEVQKADGSKMKLSYDYVKEKKADEIVGALTKFISG